MDYQGIYQQIWSLWKEKRLLEAEQQWYQNYQQAGVRTLRGMLLLAYILRDEKKYVSEVKQLQELLALFNQAEEKNLLADAWSLLGSVLRTLGESALSVEAFLKSADLDPDPCQKLVECSNAIFTANTIADCSAERMQELYAQYRNLLMNLPVKLYDRPDWHHSRIRVGYLSGDLHNHPVAQFVRPLLLDYDARRFAVYVYQLDAVCDEITRKLQAGGVTWRQVQGTGFAELAAQIRADEIDSFVDLSGHTAGNALPVFAWRPALVQLSGIGYFNSTGLAQTDGFLSDIYCAPEKQSPYFTESLLRLPHSHFCYQPFTDFPTVGSPPCLHKKYVTFGCFNNFAKVNDGILLLWKQIMEQSPDARLLLKHSLFASCEGREYTLQHLRRLGLSLERIEMRGFSADYLEQYHDIDIALDTSPYPGGLTTCEALYMGVPVVTLVGNRHGARFGYSFLANLGLTELAADSPQDYVSIAVQLSRNPDLLQQLRRTLRSMMHASPLMDGKQYMREIEIEYRRILENGERGMQYGIRNVFATYSRMARAHKERHDS